MAKQGTQYRRNLALIAENIQRLRRESGISQEALSRQCGLHYSYVGRLERRTSNPRLNTLCTLAEALDTTVIGLLTPHKSRG